MQVHAFMYAIYMYTIYNHLPIFFFLFFYFSFFIEFRGLHLDSLALPTSSLYFFHNLIKVIIFVVFLLVLVKLFNCVSDTYFNKYLMQYIKMGKSYITNHEYVRLSCWQLLKKLLSRRSQNVSSVTILATGWNTIKGKYKMWIIYCVLI